MGPNQCPATCFSHQHSAILKFNRLHIKVGEINPAEHFELFQVQSIRILQISTSALRFEKDVNFVGGGRKSHFSSAVLPPKCSEILHLSVFDNFNSARCALSRLKTPSLIDRSCHVEQAYLLLLPKFCIDTEHDIDWFHRTFSFTCSSFQSVAYTTQ